jgi:hypothetical protein
LLEKPSLVEGRTIICYKTKTTNWWRKPWLVGGTIMVGKTTACYKKPSIVGEPHHLLANTTICWRKPLFVGENHYLLEKTITCWENHHLLGEPSLVGRTITC